MTTKTPSQAPASDSYAGCGTDCVLVDDICRCYYGEPTIAMPTWLDDIDPPY